MYQPTGLPVLLMIFLPFRCAFAQTTQISVDWTFETSGRVYSTPVVEGNMVYFGSGDHLIYAVDIRTGNEEWSYRTEGEVHATPAIDGDRIFISSADGKLYCLDKNKGELIWTFESKGEQKYGLWDYYLSSPKVSDGVVYWGSGDGQVYAVHAEYGAELWSFQTEGIVHADPVIHGESIFIGSFDGHLYKLNKDNGALIWSFRTIGALSFPAGEIQKAVAIHGDFVYFGSRDYNFYVVHAKTGRGVWNYRQPRGWIIATPTIYKDHVYYGSSDGHKVYCFNINTAEKVWEKPVNMRVYASATPREDEILFATFDGKIISLDRLTGEEQWTFQLEDSKQNYATIFKTDGSFRDDFQLYGEDYLRSEEMIHKLGSILSDPVLHDDHLFFGSSNGRVYRLSLR